MARFIDDTVKAGNEDDEAALAAFGVGAERAEELRAKAKEILAASTVKAGMGKRVSQRALDIQDGRVLVLVDMVQRTFRLARRSDRSILMPELNRLAASFDTGPSAGAAKEARAAKGGAAPEADKGTP